MATIEERLKDAPSRLVILAACGFARTVEHLLTDKRSRDAVETAERFADGLGTTTDVREAVRAACAAVDATVRATNATWAAVTAARSAWAAAEAAAPAGG